MQFKKLITAALAGSAIAQSSNMSICDKYTTALLMNNTAANQYTVLTLLVNTAVIGNFSFMGFGNKVAVAGILANGTYMGQQVSLLPYFSGGLVSTNRNNAATAVNFLDDGGAAPLMQGKPANGTSSNQYRLLSHLYQYFGILLGCSGYGSMGFPTYAGVVSQYTVHKYMSLNNAQLGYFIEQVGLSAASFGVSQEDVTTVGNALNKAFNYACIPASMIVPNTTAVLNSMCLDATCPQNSPANCSAYDNSSNGTSVRPQRNNGTATNGTSGSGTGATGTGSSASGTATRGAAAQLAVPVTGLGALFLAFFAL